MSLFGQRILTALKHFMKNISVPKPERNIQNLQKGFKSYFLSFDGGSRFEIMQRTGVSQGTDDRNATFGYVHIAVSVGEMQDVVLLLPKGWKLTAIL